MSRSDVRVFVVVGSAAVLAALVGVAAWRSFPAADGREIETGAILLPLIVAGRLFPVPVAWRRRLVTDTAPLFAAALLLPPGATAALAAIAILPAELASGLRSELYVRQVIFNTAQAVIGVTAASATFAVLPGGGTVPPADSLGTLAIFAAGAVMLVVNDLLVFCVVWAQTGLRPHRMAWDYVRGRMDLGYDVALYGAGAIAALTGGAEPLLLVLLALPLPVVYRGMQTQNALHVQTREAVIALADVVDARDPYTFGHCKRVAEFATEICGQLGLSRDLTDEIVLAARVHDVGKIGIRDAVLLKPGRLTDEEYAHIQGHPDIGARLTARFPDFARGTRYIRHHHERWDGGGYPSRLRGREIPLGARIIAVADTYDAITSTRVYRAGLDEAFARAEMAAAAGTQLDREVVDAWFRARGWTWPEAEREEAPRAA